MALRCRPGDMAVFVGGKDQRSLGRIVTVVRLVIKPQIVAPNGEKMTLTDLDLWEIDTPVFQKGNVPMGIDLGEIHYARDGQLRPLRDNDGIDETLTWKERPAGQQTRVPVLLPKQVI